MWRDRDEIAASLEKASIFIRQYPIGRKVYDSVGGTPLVLQLILGLSFMTALIGLFSKYPYVAIACGAVIAYYGVGAYVKFSEWWTHNNVEDKLIYKGMAAQVTINNDKTANVVPQFIISNIAPFDVMMVIDSARARIGSVHSQQDHRNSGGSVIQSNTFLGLTSEPIFRVPLRDIAIENQPETITIEFSIRYGRNRKSMSRRWFLTVENMLPPALSGIPSSRGTEWNVLRNDLELIVE
jgi:hypothetical protein